MRITVYILILFFAFFGELQAQKDSVNVKTQIKAPVYNALSPAKAAFLSAVIPGAGQIYNNRYWWQLPLIYGGLGYSTYSYIKWNNTYKDLRKSYSKRLAGLTEEDEYSNLSNSGFESAQEQANSNRNYSILFVILTYVLQITEASVRAHLLQFDTSKDLSITPTAIPDYNLKDAPKVGLTVKYSF